MVSKPTTRKAVISMDKDKFVNSKRLTLVEVIAGVAILGIIVGVDVVSVAGIIEDPKVKV